MLLFRILNFVFFLFEKESIFGRYELSSVESQCQGHEQVSRDDALTQRLAGLQIHRKDNANTPQCK